MLNKEKELNDLRQNLINYSIIKRDLGYNIINSILEDGKVNYGIKYLKTDIFANVKTKSYKKYDEYRNTNNHFIFELKMILKFQPEDKSI